MTISISAHRINRVVANRNDYPNAPLHLEFSGDDAITSHDIALFLDDDALTTKLVEAINRTVREHRELQNLENVDV
ncbi:MAG: hypothetical protein EPN91_05795 [Salinibacterium sp.]|nr:MAG: hypothetical protein EPN91_05795 [Salinibacterium sp.]